MTLTDVITLLPLYFLLTWAVLLLMADLWIPSDKKGLTASLAALGLLISLVITVVQSGNNQTAFNDMAVVDGFARFLDVLFLTSGIAAVGLAYSYLKRMELEKGEYYILLMFSISGMMLMTYANDLIIVFLALELLSIPLYVLAGFAQKRIESEEASLKYFLLGTFAAAFVLYGTAMIFGGTGHTDLPGILAATKTGVFHFIYLVGSAFLLVGFAFKIAIVPFHQWAPDVYQGAPTPVTGFMSIGAKAAGIAALLRVFFTAFQGVSDTMVPVLWVLAALTMVVGNVTALAQSNIKRLLGYSSIAHGGYLMMAFVSYGQQGTQSQAVSSMLFYLAAYALTSFAAWAVVIAREQSEGRGLELADFAGMGKKHPWLAVAMMIAMFSFTGVPLTLGFWGKFYLFRTAVQGGYEVLALIGLLSSVVSAYYYLKIVVLMYMQPGEPEVIKDRWLTIIAIVSAACVLLLSFAPQSLINWVSNALLLVQ